MKVLILSPYPERIAKTIEGAGDDWVSSEDPLTEDPNVDFIVSYGYRHMIREPVVSRYAGKAVNLHISYLPWNRGSDPNFWSFVDDTPKGVTIHLIDKGLDTGKIVARRPVTFDEGETLATSYAILREKIEELFNLGWPLIRSGLFIASAQRGDGSYHRAAEKAEMWKRLPLGYDTPVSEIGKSYA